MKRDCESLHGSACDGVHRRSKYETSDPERMQRQIRAKSTVTASGCWEWNGYREGGYGRLNRALAHRFSYFAFVGRIPADLTLDHLCRNRACVNPAHLEPCTTADNVRRSPIAAAVVNAAKTVCSRGHEYNEENTYYDKDGNRDCKRCVHIRSLEYRRRKGMQPKRQVSPEQLAEMRQLRARGLSGNEIASLTGWSLGTVYNKLREVS